jgi:hypothetical protein
LSKNNQNKLINLILRLKTLFPYEGIVPGIITIGRGFRDIVKLASGINTEQTTSDDVFDDDNPKRSAMKSYTHMLSWFDRNWEYF